MVQPYYVCLVKEFRDLFGLSPPPGIHGQPDSLEASRQGRSGRESEIESKMKNDVKPLYNGNISTIKNSIRYPDKIVEAPPKVIPPVIGVDERLQKVLFCLNLLGSCPIAVAGRIAYWKWCSLTTIRCVLTALGFLFVLFVFGTHQALGLFFVLNPSSRALVNKFETVLLSNGDKSAVTLVGVLRLVLVLIPIYLSTSLLCGWYSSRHLKEYWNTWRHLQHQFQQTFPHFPERLRANPEVLKGSRSVSKSVNWLSVGLVAYVLLSTFAPIIMIPTYFTNSRDEIILFCLSLLQMEGIGSLEDSKVILMCVTMTNTFKKIRSAINHCVKCERNVTDTKIQAWRQLLCQVKRQNDLLAKCLAPTEIVFIVNTIVVGTCCLYLGLNISWSTVVGQRLAIVAVSICNSFLLRLFVKASFAEEITHEEHQIAQDLAIMNATIFPESVFKQVKFTCDWIIMNPATIILANYVTLNKRLFLGVFGQVITYLIVLMQFYQTRVY